jgi:PAS domain S-box-containing protein
VFERDFVPVFVENEYRGHLWNYTDVTEKKKYLDAVAASEEKYRSIIANMNLGLLEVDNNDIVQYCNQSFTHISGYSLDEIKGKKASQLFISSVEMQSQVDEKHKVRNEGKSDSYEIQIKNKNGEQRWWLISGAPNYNDQKELIGSIGIHLDITEQKRLERELEIALLKAQDASKAKEVFLANMSHEIRTPLNAIIGMIRELGRENLTPKQNSYLENCKTAAKHLLSIVNNILDMSKIEAGEFELDNQDFSLASVINMAQSILHAKAAEKNLLLLINIAPEIKPALIGDGSRIRQILINLLGNSIKFTERGFVELKVEAKHTNPYFQQLLFRIHDTGIGMSYEFLNSVFDKFSQEDTEAGRRLNQIILNRSQFLLLLL